MKLTALRVAFLIGVAVATIHLVNVILNPYGGGGLVERIELKLLDARMRSRPHGNDVVVVAADERSIEAYGRFPWKRTRFAELVSSLDQHYGAKVIAFDAVFSDPDEDESYTVLRTALERVTSAGLLSTGGLWGGLDRDLRLLDQRLRHELAPEGGEALPRVTRCARPGTGPVDGLASPALIPCLADRLKLARGAAQQLHDSLEREITTISPDEAFAAALAIGADKVVMGYILLRQEAELQGLDRAALTRGLDTIAASNVDALYLRKEVAAGAYLLQDAGMPLSQLETRDSVAIRAPLPQLAAVLKHFAYFNVSPDADGTMRRIDLLERIGGHLVPSLALKSTALYLGRDIQPVVGGIRATGFDGFEFSQDHFVPTDTSGRMLISYFGDPLFAVPSYSVTDVINKKVPVKALAGKLVVFGATAIGTFDQRVSPFGEFTPGVAIHAAAMQSILDNRFLRRTIYAPLLEVFGILLLALVIGLVAGHRGIITGGIVSIAVLAGVLLLDYYVIFPGGQWLRLVPFLAGAGLTYLGVTVFRYLTEQRAKTQLRKAFQFYMTPSVVDQVVRDPGLLKLGGDKRELSVLFSDIRGFTTISESLSPEDLVTLLNEYLTPMTEVVFRYDGTLDKYIGDALMAIYGAPLHQDDHARRACHSALDMMVELEHLKAKWAKAGWPEINIGIGVNTGPMSVGNMGSTIRFDYTVMGDNVNLASRLEGITKAYGVPIVVSEVTFEACGDTIHGRLLDAVRVKGKAQPVPIYEVVGKGAADGQTAAWMSAYEQALTAYRQQEWDQAEELFKEVHRLKLDDPPSKVMLERITTLRTAELLWDWDGVYTMTSK